MSARPIPAGARLERLALHQDARGTLVAFDRDTPPFEPARTFVIFDVPPQARRAARPAACDEFLWAARGACRLTPLVVVAAKSFAEAERFPRHPAA
jgi:hypothetical protein